MFALLVVLLMNTTCNEDDCCYPNPVFCEQSVVVDDDLFETTESSGFNIIGAVIEDDCLLIEFSASGCDTSTWLVAVYGSTNYDLSSPVISRFVKFNLNNNEACAAVFTSVESFNLESLQVEESNSIIINLEGWEEELLYQYEAL